MLYPFLCGIKDLPIICHVLIALILFIEYRRRDRETVRETETEKETEIERERKKKKGRKKNYYKITTKIPLL